MAQKRLYQKKWIILLQDMILSMLASLLSILLVRWVSEPIYGFTSIVLKWTLAAGISTLAGSLVTGLYLDVRRFATVRSIGKIVAAVLIKEVVLLAVLLLGLVRLDTTNCVIALVSDVLLTGLLLSYVRLQARLFIRQNRSVSQLASSRSALVVGTGVDSIQLADDLEKEGYSIAGLLTTDREMSGRVIHDRVVYFSATRDDLGRLQQRLGGIDGIFFPKSETELIPTSGLQEEETPQRDGMSLLGHAVKRAFDITLSATLLAIFSPLMAVVAIMIKKEDGGPVIYAQERIGRGGVAFNIYKFRSMRTDAEAAGVPELYGGDDDPRLTRTGRFLRAHHLDELPQLYNVLRGDMSFIGYRPERKYYIDRIMARNARYRYLFQIRPGVTSYATLYNGYTDTLEKMLTRLDLDLYYLRNHSVWFDTKVLALTFLSIVTGKKF